MALSDSNDGDKTLGRQKMTKTDDRHVLWTCRAGNLDRVSDTFLVTDYATYTFLPSFYGARTSLPRFLLLCTPSWRGAAWQLLLLHLLIVAVIP